MSRTDLETAHDALALAQLFLSVIRAVGADGRNLFSSNGRPSLHR
jgi:hypothetical protein